MEAAGDIDAKEIAYSTLCCKVFSLVGISWGPGVSWHSVQVNPGCHIIDVVQ